MAYLADIETSRERKRLGSARYRAENKERLTEYRKKRAGYNNEISKNWYRENIERAKENRRFYSMQNKEKVKLCGRASRSKNKEQVRKRTDLYRKAHLDRYNVYCQNRRTKKLGNGGVHTVKEWEALKAKYNYSCLRCGKSESVTKLTKDHVFPIALGGKNDITNLQPLCHSCNCSKHNKYMDYRPDSKTYGEGWKQPSLWGRDFSIV